MKRKIKQKPWFVYILLCKNKALYAGITTDLDRRMLQHTTGKGAKYTRAAQPKKFVYFKKYKNRSLASKEEARIKKLSRIQKQAIFNEN